MFTPWQKPLEEVMRLPQSEHTQHTEVIDVYIFTTTLLVDCFKRIQYMSDASKKRLFALDTHCWANT